MFSTLHDQAAPEIEDPRVKMLVDIVVAPHAPPNTLPAVHERTVVHVPAMQVGVSVTH